MGRPSSWELSTAPAILPLAPRWRRHSTKVAHRFSSGSAFRSASWTSVAPALDRSRDLQSRKGSGFSLSAYNEAHLAFWPLLYKPQAMLQPPPPPLLSPLVPGHRALFLHTSITITTAPPHTHWPALPPCPALHTAWHSPQAGTKSPLFTITVIQVHKGGSGYPHTNRDNGMDGFFSLTLRPHSPCTYELPLPLGWAP